MEGVASWLHGASSLKPRAGVPESAIGTVMCPRAGYQCVCSGPGLRLGGIAANLRGLVLRHHRA